MDVCYNARSQFGRALRIAVGIEILLFSSSVLAATLQVGPGQDYSKPCQAIADAAPGDTIQIDASGNYAGDVCSIKTSNLTIVGVNGRPRIDAAGQNASGKGIWVVDGDNTVIDNIEFSGATVPDHNGAGLRVENTNLIVRRCYFHDNEDGILAADNPNSQILIEYSEFNHNGAGDGQTHNMYINHVGRFTLQYSYSHNANVGHLVKTRAAENYILYNRLTSETGSTASYKLEMPNGGKSYVIGNVFEQSATDGNFNIVAYLFEGLHPSNPDNQLYVVNNTFMNDSPSGYFVGINAVAPKAAVIQNNIFAGAGIVTNQANAVMKGNFIGNPSFVDQANYDYHLTVGSPAMNIGVDMGAMNPVFQYVHPTCNEQRFATGAMDAGAYSFNGGGGLLPCNASSTPDIALTSLTFDSDSITGGAIINSNITLTAPAPSGGAAVTITSSNGAATAAAGVIIPEGSTSGSFSVTTLPVGTPTPVVMLASRAGGSMGAALTINPGANSAQFLKTDATTQGNWIGAYGTDGFFIPNDASRVPSYAQVSFTNQIPYTWLGSTSDVRALQRTNANGRSAATWYSDSSLKIDVNFTDGAPHRVAIYCLDWDANGRTEKVTVLDPDAGYVLDTRNLSNFMGGQYLVWNLRGHTVIQVTNTGHTNAVVNGLFFDAAASVGAPQ